MQKCKNKKLESQPSIALTNDYQTRPCWNQIFGKQRVQKKETMKLYIYIYIYIYKPIAIFPASLAS